jgi:hypothetical protein
VSWWWHFLLGFFAFMGKFTQTRVKLSKKSMQLFANESEKEARRETLFQHSQQRMVLLGALFISNI